MYSPYYATLIFAVLQAILLLVATAMQSCKMVGTTKYIYRAVMVAMVLCDILMLFAMAMGVGASGYDSGSKTCYLL